MTQARPWTPIALALVMLGMAVPSAALAQPARPARAEFLVGAIRWDNWTPESPHAPVVLDGKWPDRVPFFAYRDAEGKARLLGGTGPVARAENLYGHSAGLDYWLFNYYAPTGSYGRTAAFTTRINRALEAYRALPDRGGMRFALLLQQSYPESDLNKLVPLIGTAMADRDYVRLADGASPLFAQSMREWEKALGSEAAVRRFFTALRDRIAARLGRPVRLVLVGSDLAAIDDYTGEGAPFEVFTSYADAPPNDGKTRSAQACEAASRDFWRRALALRKPFIPNALLGWDMRPTLAHPDQLYGRSTTPGTCAPATEAEWIAYIADARRTAALGARDPVMPGLLFYAWNELAEGGWIVPTQREGARRIGVLARALGRSARVPARATLVYPDDGDPRTHSDEWPCPAGMRVAEESAAPADAEMRRLHPGRWTRRTCARAT